MAILTWGQTKSEKGDDDNDGFWLKDGIDDVGDGNEDEDGDVDKEGVCVGMDCVQPSMLKE